MVNVIPKPVVNAPSLYVNGFGLQSPSSNLFSVNDGAARDSTNTADIIVTTSTGSTSVNISTVGLNGADAAISTTTGLMHVYAIASSISTPTGRGAQTVSVFDPSTGAEVLDTIAAPTAQYPSGFICTFNNPLTSAPTLPAGYNLYRRIGSIYLHATATISGFFQENVSNSTSRKMWYQTKSNHVLESGANSTSWDNFTTSVSEYAPYSCGSVIFEFGVTSVLNNVTSMALRPKGSTSSAGITQTTLGGGAAMAYLVTVESPVDLAGTPSTLGVEYQLTNSSGTPAWDAWLAGYVDEL